MKGFQLQPHEALKGFQLQPHEALKGFQFQPHEALKGFQLQPHEVNTICHLDYLHYGQHYLLITRRASFCEDLIIGCERMTACINLKPLKGKLHM